MAVGTGRPVPEPFDSALDTYTDTKLTGRGARGAASPSLSTCGVRPMCSWFTNMPLVAVEAPEHEAGFGLLENGMEPRNADVA